MLLREASCLEVIANAWEGGHDVCINIRRTSEKFSKWSNSIFGNFAKEMRECKARMQKLMEEDQTQEIIDQMRAIDERMDELEEREELYWRQWKFIYDEAGMMHEDEKQVAEVFVTHFESLFKSNQQVEVDPVLDKKVVGTGHSIEVRKDPWVPGLPNLKTLPQGSRMEEGSMVVPDLLENGQWNLTRLQENFSQWEVECISHNESIMLALVHCGEICDVWRWSPLRIDSSTATAMEVINKAIGIVGEFEKANEKSLREMVIPQYCKVGLGGVKRDYVGEIIMALCMMVRGNYAIYIVEAMAARQALMVVVEAGLRGVIVETDN
ncbi:Aspartyl/glutamyl-tRNA(Asn/Gln) amidotransferase subunit C [Bienertia sinuspersici]